MTTSPAAGRGGSAGEALSRLKRPKLAKAAERSVVEEMSAPDPVVSLDEPLVQPVQVRPTAAMTEIPDPAFVAAPSQQPAPAEAAEQRAVPRRKMSFAPTLDEHDRIRSAFMSTRHLTRYATLNDFLRAVVLEECTRLEDEHNDGAAFEWTEAEIPKGRPLRFEPRGAV